MEKIKNVLICGIGAVGLTFAVKIQNKSPDCLKVLVNKQRFDKYSFNPPKMNGEEKFFNYILPDNTDYKADLVIIATKFDGLQAVCENLKNFVGENTIILPILNGIEAEEFIAQKFGWERVLYGYFIGHSAMRVGNSVIQDGVGKIVFGASRAQMQKIAVARVAEFFSSVNVDFEIPENIIYSKWLKFALNIVSNQISCILKMTFGDMQKSKNFHSFARNIVNEVAQLAKQEGIIGWENLQQDFEKALLLMSTDGKTSMLQDVEAKKKTELEIFAGAVIRLGTKHNQPTPYNQVLYEMIKIIEEEF